MIFRVMQASSASASRLCAAALVLFLVMGAAVSSAPIGGAYAADAANSALSTATLAACESTVATQASTLKASASSKASATKKSKALSWKKCLAYVKAVSRMQDLQLSNRVSGYKVSSTRWKAVQKAIRSCHANGFGVGFVMLDCNTGMAVTYNQDYRFYGSSTIKGLYVTYLFQSCLEKRWYSYKKLKGKIRRAIVRSDNAAYLKLRSHYGSQRGFRKWLHKASVGSLGVWVNYTPRTLAKAWTRMYGYTKSKGRYVKAWKSMFRRSTRSFIREELGTARTAYTKPGWTPGWYSPEKGPSTNDAGVIYDHHGRQYVLAILSTQDSERSNAPLRQLVRALDALHMSMPTSR